MVTELFTDAQVLRGLLAAIIGVGFWIVGPIVAYLVWKRYQGDVHGGQE